MITITVAGHIGKDAEYKTTQGGDQFCRFSVPGSTGFSDRQQTIWFDVTKWGKGAEGLSKHLLKGTAVAVTGELSTREHEGKTYLQIRADRIKLLGGRSDNRQSRSGGGGSPFDDDTDDSVPF